MPANPLSIVQGGNGDHDIIQRISDFVESIRVDQQSNRQSTSHGETASAVVVQSIGGTADRYLQQLS